MNSAKLTRQNRASPRAVSGSSTAGAAKADVVVGIVMTVSGFRRRRRKARQIPASGQSSAPDPVRAAPARRLRRETLVAEWRSRRRLDFDEAQPRGRVAGVAGFGQALESLDERTLVLP